MGGGGLTNTPWNSILGGGGQSKNALCGGHGYFLELHIERKLRQFRVAVEATKCIKDSDACAELLFCKLNLLSFGVLVADTDTIACEILSLQIVF